MCKLYLYYNIPPEKINNTTSDIILSRVNELIQVIKQKNKYNIKVDTNFTKTYSIVGLEKYINQVQAQIDKVSLKHKVDKAIKDLQQSNDIKLLYQNSN